MDKFTDVMCDIETLNTVASATVLSIGLVAFDRHNPDRKPVKLTINMGQKQFRDEQKRFGRTQNADTVRWWKKQSAQAKEVFQRANVTNCEHACTVLIKFFNDNTDPRNVKMWGNGSDFDNVIVADFLTTFGHQVPWKFWNNRCHRTMKSEFKHLLPNIEFTGVQHNAADDAHHQVKQLWAIYGGLGFMEETA